MRSLCGKPAAQSRRAADAASALPISRRSLLAGAGAAAWALAAAGSLAASGCSPSAGGDGAFEGATSSTFAFDTYCTFTVYGDDAAPAALARECARYDALFDLYDPESDIARVNAAGGAATVVDPDTADIVSRSLEYCERFDGLFDVTIGAVSTLWDFEEGVRPSDEAIAAALPHVDGADSEGPTIALSDPEAKLDLGAIAKGYIADRLCSYLADNTDATGAAISLGGNIAYFGEKPDGTAWETGIRDPNDPGGSTLVGTLETARGSYVTSGLYERTFELDGVDYWHVLDPSTGMPVETDVVSVTVACPASTQADALSTALFVAGSSQGLEIVDGLDDTAALFLLSDGTSVASSRWRDLTGFEPS